MYLLRTHAIRLVGVLSNCGKQEERLFGMVLFLIMGVVWAAMLAVGAPCMTGFAWDVPMLLDGAWRIHSGQVPHVDFFSHLGPLPFYVTYVGMLIRGACVAAVSCGNVLLSLSVVLIGWFALRKRTSPFVAALVCLFWGILLVAPRHLGAPYYFLDHAMVYNKYGEVFLGFLSILVLLGPLSSVQRHRVDLSAVLAGLLLSGLFLTKLSYFCVGLFMVGVGSAVSFRRLLSGGITLLVMCVSVWLFCSASGIGLGAMWNDFSVMAAAQSLDIKLSNIVIRGIKTAHWFLPLCLVALEVSAGTRCEKPLGLIHALWPVGLCVVLFGWAVVLLATNHQISELPLTAVAAVIMLETVRRQNQLMVHSPEAIRNVRFLVCAAVLMGYVSVMALQDIGAIRSAVFLRAESKEDATGLENTNLSDFRFSYRHAWTRGRSLHAYRSTLIDGIALIRRHNLVDARLLVADIADPFCFALGLPPARGGAVFWAENLFNKRSRPPLAKMLGDSTIVLTRRENGMLDRIYGDVRDSFGLDVIDESVYWLLLRVRPRTEASDAARPDQGQD
jgi:hypothetical protein